MIIPVHTPPRESSQGATAAEQLSVTTTTEGSGPGAVVSITFFRIYFCCQVMLFLPMKRVAGDRAHTVAPQVVGACHPHTTGVIVPWHFLSIQWHATTSTTGNLKSLLFFSPPRLLLFSGLNARLEIM